MAHSSHFIPDDMYNEYFSTLTRGHHSPYAYDTSTLGRRPNLLLTPTSLFSSHKLPPLGTVARRDLGPGTNTVTLFARIGIEAQVHVRRWDFNLRRWGPWRKGKVVGHRIERFHAGLELDLYDVLTFPDSKDASIDSYMPYLAELYDDITTFKPRDGLPDQNMEELLNKIFETRKVYAAVVVPCLRHGTHMVQYWTPALVYSTRDASVNQVITLAEVLQVHLQGCTRLLTKEILPFNARTADAIKSSGFHLLPEKGPVDMNTIKDCQALLQKK